MNSSRNSSTTDSESMTGNENDEISCDESTAHDKSDIIYTSAILTPSNTRYFVNNSTADMKKINESNLVPSISGCGPQLYLENNFMYRTFSYGPTLPSYTNHPHFIHQQHQHPHSHALLHQQQKIIERNIPIQFQQQIPGEYSTIQKQKAQEYVSIRYFAPVEHVTPKIGKGETINASTLRQKLPISAVHYAPAIGTFNEKRLITSANSTGYLSDGKINTASFQHFYEPNKNRMINLESSQQQLLPNKNSKSNGSNETNSTLSRPALSSLWNLTGSVGNINQRFYKEIQSDNNLNKFYDRQGGTLDKKSFSQKFGKSKNGKMKRNCTIVGSILGVIAVIVIIACILLFALPNSIFKNGIQSLTVPKSLNEPRLILNSTTILNGSEPNNHTIPLNSISQINNTTTMLPKPFVNSTQEIINGLLNETLTKSDITTTKPSFVTTLESTVVSFISNIQEKSSQQPEITAKPIVALTTTISSSTTKTTTIDTSTQIPEETTTQSIITEKITSEETEITTESTTITKQSEKILTEDNNVYTEETTTTKDLTNIPTTVETTETQPTSVITSSSSLVETTKSILDSETRVTLENSTNSDIFV